jgi:hypothetical protein
VLADAFHDAAGNGNTASNQISRIRLSTMNIWVKSDAGLFKDAAKTQAATADDDLIYTWDNLSSGNDFVQATEGNRPKLVTVSGVKWVRFDNIDDFMTATISADASQTIYYIAHKYGAITTASDIIFAMANANANLFFDSDLGPGYLWAQNEASGVTALGGDPTNPHYVSLVVTDNTAASFRFNGGAAVTFDPKNSTYESATALILGSRGSGGLPCDADFYEVIQCTSPHDDTTRAAVEAYLATRNPT